MDFNDTPDEAIFRAQARAWLAENAPAHEVSRGVVLDDGDQVSRAKAWQRALYDGGFAGITFPKALGGRGGSAAEGLIFREEESPYRLPKGPYISIGLGMAVQVIGKHGTDEQRAHFIEPTLKGDLIWCQLFSEPAAGSDLANLRMKAVRDGADWIVNGQKIWSSWAHEADWGILVVRTDPALPKHKGLTFFVVPMKNAGIDIRPIRQISDASDFNETFFTDVRIPDVYRIGAPGEGWACCMTVLMGERLGTGSTKGDVRRIIEYAAATPRGSGNALDSSAVRLALASALAEERGGKYLEARLRTMVSRGEDPGALSGMVKYAYAGREQRILGLAMEIRGLGALAPRADDAITLDLQRDYIWSTVMRIAGGADEVLKNQIAERILGMPGEFRADKNIPFNEL
jgi:acyl-CoA dehydrogenase